MNNIDPKLWGNHAWMFLHSITFGYPENPSYEDKEHYKKFFKLLKYVLPCEKCRDNFYDSLKEYPLTDDVLDSREALIEWLICIRNMERANKGGYFQRRPYNKSDIKHQIGLRDFSYKCSSCGH